MGIYDRDYYRNDNGYRPFDTRMQACVTLIAIYVVVFLLQMATLGNARLGQFGPITEYLTLDAGKVLNGEVWRLFTYSFLHDPRFIFPIVINILFLIWFGRQVEDLYGWKEFLSFYFTASLLGGLAFILVGGVTQNLNMYMMGPACSVTAVLFLFALHYPRRTVLLFFVLPCPVWFLVVFHVLNDALGFFGGRVHPSVFAAHLAAGGFAFLYHKYTLRVSNWLPSVSSKNRPKKRPKLQIFRDETTTNEPVPVVPSYSASSTASPEMASASASALDEHLEAKLDEVLDKVKNHGQESLTEEERAVLFRASEIYRKRRKLGGN
ncbi:MAG: rhomboid family intramembrane serine protease [Planctomycetes bacterium]|nr:rhomboid family intramembrane serine protease [Planctomycetota bacterium]